MFLRNKFCCSSSDLKFDKGVNIFSVSLLLKYFPLMPLVFVASWKSTMHVGHHTVACRTGVIFFGILWALCVPIREVI